MFVREVGQEDYDIMYLGETIPGPDGSPVPLSIELLHQLVKEATGKAETEEVTKLSANGIIVRNINGIRFLLKNPEPKLEVTFASTKGTPSFYFFVNISVATAAPPAPVAPQAAVVPGVYPGVSPLIPMPTVPVYTGAGTSKWLTVLDTAPTSFGHTGTCVNGQLLVFGGFMNESTDNQCLLLSDFTRAYQTTFTAFILGIVFRVYDHKLVI